MEKQYAQAIATMSRTKGHSDDVLVSALVNHLRSRGRSKLLPGILRELKHEQARNEKLAPMLEVATEGEEAAAKAFLVKECVEIKKVEVNPSLIQGWRARANGFLWDHSAKRALTDIYKKITN
jgi:F0F1-type ATP synthase delta subunit